MTTATVLAINATHPTGLTFLTIFGMFFVYITVESWLDKRRAPAMKKLELKNIEQAKSEGYDYEVRYDKHGLFKHIFIKDGKSSEFLLEDRVMRVELLNECLRLADD